MDKQNVIDLFVLERVRKRLASGEPFSLADVEALTDGSEQSVSLVARTVKRFQELGVIVSTEEENGAERWIATARGVSILNPKPEPLPEVRIDEPAIITVHQSEVGNLYYVKPLNRAAPPYLQQRHVDAILDIDADGFLAGIELIDHMPTLVPGAGKKLDVDSLAQEIRRVDGDNKMGAGELAEALLAFLTE